ncbi:3-dehydroquinate synthase [Candidatus Aerophobetes bacterium]|nr:3-dehydroquinate synthase [Candidatus Aerophobetes bacterium]
MNIALLGFMGTGKTAVAKELARHLGMKYIDTDEMIEKREKLSIPEIFARFGEDYFRKLETEVVKELSEFNNFVISTGGGVPLRRENINALKSKGYLVCLEASPEVILGRTKNYEGERPLLAGFIDKKKRIQELLEKRRLFYNQADFIIDTSHLSVEDVVEKVIKSLPEEKLRVNLKERSYPIFIGTSIDEVGKVTRDFSLGGKILIISDANVFPLYGEKVRRSLEKENFQVKFLQISPGERSKSLSRARKIYDFCLRANLDRTSSILALGGGVVGDLTGFVAATFLRGINFLMVPTTLLSQVDSSAGGKVGVNLPQGKNLIGAFYQPKFVLVDPLLLKTLSARRMREGVAEVVKCAIINNSFFFSYLEENIVKALMCDLGVLRSLIKKALEVKIKVVQEDELEEKGIRQILNFGHTIAHAIEATSKYGRYTHGEAVAIGMVGAGRIGVEMGIFSSASFFRVENLLQKAKLPTRARGLGAGKVFEALKFDKKVRAGRLFFVLPEEIGKVSLRDDVPLNLVKKVIEELIV